MLPAQARSENGLPSDLQGYASWQHPFSGTKIYIPPGLIRTLSNSAIDALKKSQASEIGGILWGNRGADTDERIVITDAEFVAAEGKLYNTVASDTRALIRTLQKRPDHAVSVVGYFRSHIREGLCLSPQDQGLIEQQIRDPRAVFLVIKPFDLGICMAGFFFWRNGLLQTEESDLEVPFIAPSESPNISSLTSDTSLPSHPADAVLTNLKKPISPNSEAAESTIQAGVHSFAAQNTIIETQPQKRILLSRSVAFLLVLVLIGSGVYLVKRLQPFRRTFGTGIDFRVRQVSKEQFALSWNKTASAFQNGERATLTITDGKLSRDLTLDNNQLHSGKILYSANSPDVRFNFAVNHDDKEGRHKSITIASADAQIHRENTPLPALARVHPRANRDATRRGVDEVATKKPALHQAPKTIPTRLPEAAVVSKPKSTIAVAKQAMPVYIPPRPIQQVLPDTNPPGLSKLFDGAHVSVQVHIDQTGRVITAQLIRTDAGVDPSVAESSLTAARQWLFEPAIQKGKPIAAEHIIVFNFHSSLR